tara:strand:- start:7081 stop:8058 length:978 start_codon:yes stop_codon:yes gene_type:complete
LILLRGRIDKPRHQAKTMTDTLPPKVPFHALTLQAHSKGYLAVGIDGEFLQLDKDFQSVDEVRKPFPMAVRHTCVVNGTFVATWIDHELLMARMAAFDCSEAITDGPERGSLRTRTTLESAQHPSGSLWSHVLDAEPLALCGHEDGFAFVLYKKGIYAMGNDAGEHWRIELPTWPELTKLPRANDVVTAAFDNGLLKVWSRGGGTQSYDVETGDLVSTNVNHYDGVLEHVYCQHGQELHVYDNGSVVWRTEGMALIDAKLSGPVQHAFWSESEKAWRIAGWREELFLSTDGLKTSKMHEIPVHILYNKGKTYLLLNDGSWLHSHF